MCANELFNLYCLELIIFNINLTHKPARCPVCFSSKSVHQLVKAKQVMKLCLFLGDL